MVRVIAVRRLIATGVATTLLLLAGACSAFAVSEERNCTAVTTPPGGERGLHVVVKGQPRTYFAKSGQSDPACPSLDAKCRDTAYLVPGDVVVTGKSFGEFYCAEYEPAKGRSTSGWIHRDRLGPILPLDGAKPSAWIGTWLRRDATIVIEAGDGFSLSVKGEAICCSDDPMLREEPYTGAIEGLGTAKGSLLRIPDVDLTIDEFRFRTTECSARLRRRGAFLLVEDNNRCGQRFVSFTGLYRRR